MPKQATRTFAVNMGIPHVVRKGDIYDDDDPLVRNHPDRFGDIRVRTSPGYHVPEPEPPKPKRPRRVEAATAEPGEERGADLGG